MIVVNWGALGLVAVVAVVATLVFVTLLSGGIRLMSIAVLRTDRGDATGGARVGGAALLGLAGLLVLFGIYLIVPIFH